MRRLGSAACLLATLLIATPACAGDHDWRGQGWGHAPSWHHRPPPHWHRPPGPPPSWHGWRDPAPRQAWRQPAHGWGPRDRW